MCVVRISLVCECYSSLETCTDHIWHHPASHCLPYNWRWKLGGVWGKTTFTFGLHLTAEEAWYWHMQMSCAVGGFMSPTPPHWLSLSLACSTSDKLWWWTEYETSLSKRCGSLFMHVHIQCHGTCCLPAPLALFSGPLSVTCSTDKQTCTAFVFVSLAQTRMHQLDSTVAICLNCEHSRLLCHITVYIWHGWNWNCIRIMRCHIQWMKGNDDWCKQLMSQSRKTYISSEWYTTLGLSCDTDIKQQVLFQCHPIKL